MPFALIDGVVRITDNSGNIITAQESGDQHALDIGINVSGTVVDPRDIRVITVSDEITSYQGGTWNIENISGTISLPTGASTSANQITTQEKLETIDTDIKTSQPRKLQDGSGNAITSTTNGEKQRLDVNVEGTVIANPPSSSYTSGTISSLGGYVQISTESYQSRAIQITGTWNAELVVEISVDGGVTWAQTTLRNGMGDSVEGVIIPLIYKTIKNNGVYKPTVTGGLTHIRVRASSYTSGIVNVYINQSMAFHSFQFGQNEIIQGVIILQHNSTTTNLAGGQLWVGEGENTLGFNSIQISVICSNDLEVTIQQSQDNVNWDIIDTYQIERGIGHGRFFKIVESYVRITARNLFINATTYFRLNTKLCPISEPLPRQLTNEGNLKVAIAENYPTEIEGNTLKIITNDLELQQLLKSIVDELKIMNLHLSSMSGERFSKLDTRE